MNQAIIQLFFQSTLDDGDCKAMRTSSHICRILVTGYQSRPGASRLARASYGYVGLRLPTSTQPKSSSWQKLEEASQHAQLQLTAARDEDIASWITKCDRFLPLELRSRTWQDNLSDFQGVRSAEYLPEILSESDRVFPSGILSHIALEQRRWSAALFLCQALFRYENKVAPKASNPNNGSPWSALKEAGPLVDVKFFELPLNLWDLRLFRNNVNTIQNEPSLDYIARTSFLDQDKQAILWKSAIGQVWRCIGHVMLAATRENSPLQVDMVGFVLQVIAAMHSDEVMPDAIYLFEGNDVPATNRKSPFLHLMSSRIMTALSDAMWKKAEPDLMRDVAYVVARHSHKGSNSPAGENGPRLQALEHEVWLELILWGCVHGEHYHEGIELLRAMFSAETVHQWKTVPWNDLEELLEAKLLAQRDLQKTRTWYQRLASSMEGYSQEKPLVNLGRNTISREVVTRLCDGMLSSPNTQPFIKDQPAASAEACVSTLDIANRSATETSTNSMLYRISDTSIENVIRLGESIRPKDLATISGIASPDLTYQTSMIQAHPQHGLLVKILAHHVENLDVHKALKSYEQLKAWSGNGGHEYKAENESVSETSEIPLSSRLMDIRYLVPRNLLASLLNLITRSRLFQTGQRLIAPLVSDGKIELAHGPRKSSALADAITHFAGASSNRVVLARLREDIDFDPYSLDEEALRELVHLEISDQNWFVARRLLISMTQSRAMQILPDDIGRIAVRIIRSETLHGQSDTDKLMEILVEILSGQYRSPHSSGEAPYLREPRRLNQLSQVLLSIPSHRFPILEPLVIRDGQLGNPIKMPTSTFNMLLEAVVDTYGMETGEKLVRTWCWTNPGGKNRPGDRHFYPFSPNLETLRILIEPFTRRYRLSYIQREIFTDTGASGKDAHTLGLLRFGVGHISAAYEMILGFYYKEYGNELSTIFWAMEVCKAWKFDQGNTFYTLLQPKEELELNQSKTLEPSFGLSEKDDQ